MSCGRLLPWLAQTRNKTDANTGVQQLTKVLKIMLLSNSYLFLPRTQGDLQPTGGTRERLEERLPGETKSARCRNMWSSR
jgi:hypothetical protein